MQGLFVFTIILALLAAVTWLVVLLSRGVTAGSDEAFARACAKWVAGILTLGTALALFFSSFNTIGTRDIGVVTSFGRLAGHVGPGPDFVAPWDSVTPIDDSYQLTDETFTVRIAGGQTAQATVLVRWNAAQDSADDIYGNYKTTAGLDNGLLKPELNVATNTALDGYDPLTPLATGAAAGSPENPSTAQLGTMIQGILQQRVGTDINVRTLVLRPLVYDPTVQDRINSVTNQVAKTDVAQQSEKTALAQAAANKDLETGLVNNPLVLVQQCMNAIADGQLNPPAGFSCWPGQNSGVVIPAAK